MSKRSHIFIQFYEIYFQVLRTFQNSDCELDKTLLVIFHSRSSKTNPTIVGRKYWMWYWSDFTLAEVAAIFTWPRAFPGILKCFHVSIFCIQLWLLDAHAVLIMCASNKQVHMEITHDLSHLSFILVCDKTLHWWLCMYLVYLVYLELHICIHDVFDNTMHI